MLGGALLGAVLLGCGAAALVWGPPGWAGVGAASFAFALLVATVPALVQAAGALIGQVMKEMKGQADAAKARELILSTLGVEG